MQAGQRGQRRRPLDLLGPPPLLPTMPGVTDLVGRIRGQRDPLSTRTRSGCIASRQPGRPIHRKTCQSIARSPCVGTPHSQIGPLTKRKKKSSPSPPDAYTDFSPSITAATIPRSAIGSRRRRQETTQQGSRPLRVDPWTRTLSTRLLQQTAGQLISLLLLLLLPGVSDASCASHLRTYMACCTGARERLHER